MNREHDAIYWREKFERCAQRNMELAKHNAELKKQVAELKKKKSATNC